MTDEDLDGLFELSQRTFAVIADGGEVDADSQLELAKALSDACLEIKRGRVREKAIQGDALRAENQALKLRRVLSRRLEPGRN